MHPNPLPRLRIHVNPMTGCWEWLGDRTKDGYGTVSVCGVTRSAHCAVWTLLVGAIGDGMQLDHICRLRACVNPTHLEETTDTENTVRMLDARYRRPTVPVPALLEDVRRAFGSATRMHGADILAALPPQYDDWDAIQLARALRPYGATPTELWINGRNRRGYTLDAIRLAQQRYRAAERRRSAAAESPRGDGPILAELPKS